MDQFQSSTNGISAAHLRYLTDHAIEPALLNTVGVHTRTDGALIVPWRSVTGSLTEQIVRPELPKDQRYRFPKGVTPGLNELRPTGQLALIVEGTKQSLAAASWAPAQFAVYGMVGIWGWSHDHQPVPDLTLLAARHSSVVIIPDADAATNQDVYNACVKLRQTLLAGGAQNVRFARLVGAQDNDGLDDVLARLPAENRASYPAQLAESAQDKPADSPPNLLPPPSAPLAVARRLEHELRRDGWPTLRWWRGDWYWWWGDRWQRAETDAVNKWLYERTEKAVHQKKDELLPWIPNRTRIIDLRHALQPVLLLPDQIDSPTWLESVGPDPLPVPMANGLLRLGARELAPHDPRLFNLVSIPFDYDPVAPEPTRWLELMGQMWPGEPDHIEALQEWLGYVVSGQTDQQKILALVGPPRSGKGMVVQVARQLVGDDNFCGLMLTSFANNFGMQPLIGKTLATISEPRAGRREDRSVAMERMLAISGEDILTVSRKNQLSWTGRLPVRLIWVSNTMPVFQDDSGAIATRFIVLQTEHTVRGAEDIHLDRKLRAELPGIFNWALDGLDRMTARGRLAEPTRSIEIIQSIEDSVSPIGAFVRDRCETGPELSVAVPELYQAWIGWGVQNGTSRALSVQQLGLALRSVVPTVRTGRPWGGGSGRTRVFRGIALRMEERVGQATEEAERAEEQTGQTGTNRDKSDAPIPLQSLQSAAFPIFPVSQEEEKKSKREGKNEPRTMRTAACEPRLADPSPVGVWLVNRGGDPRPCPDLDRVRDGLLEVLTVEGVLTVDVEHTGYPVGHRFHQLKTVQLGGPDRAWVLDVRHIDRVPCPCPRCGLIRNFIKIAPALGAHSAVADLVPLYAAGLCEWSAWDRMHDTVIPAQLADPTLVGADAAGLKDLARHLLGESATAPAADQARAALFKQRKWKTEIRITDPLDRNGWALVEPAEIDMLVYAASDVLDTAAIGRKIPWPKPDLLERERRVAQVCSRVSRDGLQLFIDHIQQKLTEHRVGRKEALDRIRPFGIDNPASNPQVTKALIDAGAHLPISEKGNPSAAAEVTADIVRGGGPAAELARQLTAYRKHAHTITGFLEPWKSLVVYGDGKVRPTVYTLSADSGRMSCVRPNLQGVQRQGGTRACIGAPDGMLLIGADLQGIEIRVTAALSQDPALLELVRADRDLHGELAPVVFGPDATKEHRYRTKRGVFGWIYGGGLTAIARGLGSTEQDAGKLVAGMNAMFPLLAFWREQNMQEVRAGQTVWLAYTGRPIHLPERYPHKSSNYKVQGTAREIFVDIILDWSRTRWGDCVLLPVHDELRALVPEDQAERATAALVEIMNRQLLGVPILGEADTPARQWADAS